MNQLKSRKYKLEFASPQSLNKLQAGQYAEKMTWNYLDLPNSELIIDVEKWLITCPNNGKSGKFEDWIVNEETCQFALKKEINKDGFVEIDFPFAIAMLGQLFGRNELISYMSSLQNAFAQMKSANTPKSALK